MHVIPIASGKGGVGKSLVAANLSIALAEMGKRVILADLDLGASNLHLILGHGSVTKGIGTFLTNPGTSFADIVTSTEYPNVDFVAGDAEIPGLANLKVTEKRLIIKNLMSLDYDFLVLDLGAGTNANIVDFFLASTHGIVVTTPNLTATVNAYLFLKNSVYRIMTNSFKKNSKAMRYLEQLKKEGNAFQRLYIPKFMERIRLDDPESYTVFSESIKKFNPRLILNMLEDPKDADKAAKLRRSCREYLGIDLEHLGVMYRDDLQNIALGSRLPIIKYKPQAILSQAIYRIADKLVQMVDDDGSLLDYQTIDETFQIAEMEAEADFESKITYIEDLLHCGALTMGDLVETIKTQQFEINQLKKENQLLKSKVVKAIQAGVKL